jgi:hypothetical protein
MNHSMTTTDFVLQMIDSDRPLYEAMLRLARIHRGNSRELAVVLKNAIDTLMDDLQLKPVDTIPPAFRESADLLVRQLVQASLEDMDWKYMADHYLTKVAEGC